MTRDACPKELEAAIGRMDGAAVVKLLARAPALLSSTPPSGSGCWVGEAMVQASVQDIPFQELRPVLEALKGAASFMSDASPLEKACAPSQSRAFLWLLDNGYSLNYKPAHDAWMKLTLQAPGWVDEGKLMVSLRKTRSGLPLHCEVLAMSLLCGRPQEALRRAWCGALLGDAKPAQMAEEMGRALRLVCTKGAVFRPAKGWSLDPGAWSFLCERVGEEALRSALPGGVLDAIVSDMEHGQLQVAAPKCDTKAKIRF